MMIIHKRGLNVILSVCLAFNIMLSFFSCISTKSTTYFNNLPDSAKIILDKIEPPRPVIQVSDILDIQLGGENEKTVQYITQHFTTGGNSDGSLQAVVDVNGNIELPQIGTIKVSGMTREQLKDTVTKAYKEFLINPVVSVKFGNFRFTILGEVRSPGNYNVANEKVSIFEALAQAGDLTQYAIRDNITLIRDINGEREIRRINLNDKAILNSPDYYLNRYDLLYVEAKQIKAVNENLQRTAFYLSFLVSIAGIIILISK